MKKFALLLLLTAVPAHAFDKEKLAQHLRENLSLDTRSEIVVQGEPKPAGIGNLLKVVVTVGGAPYDVLLTTDGRRYVWGLVADMSLSPDAVRQKAISLDNVHAVGSSSAPVTLVEYSDLQCSFCKKAHDILTTELYKAYQPNQVRWVYKHFPLNMHPWAMQAALMTECASRQNSEAFWKLSDFFFANQEKLTEENVSEKGLAQAKALGLKPADIKTCMDDPKLRDRIASDKKEGTVVGVTSTPTIFINGRMRRGFRDFDDIKVVIEEKLKEKK